MHGHGHAVDADRNQRVVVEVEGITERRDEHDRAGGTHLVMVVDDLRIPFAEHHARQVHRFDGGGHDEVAVVVVADVFVIEAGQADEGTFLRIFLAHIPVGHELDAVGIGERGEQDDVVKKTPGFLIVAAQILIDRFRQLLGADALAGVQPAVDPEHGFAFLGEGLGFVIRQIAGQREARGDVAVVIELREVGGRADDRHVLVSSLAGRADFDQLHAVGFGGPRLPHLRDLAVVGDVVVVTDGETDQLLRTAYFGRGGGRETKGGGSEAQGQTGDESSKTA